jgi:hypothetical protein
MANKRGLLRISGGCLEKMGLTAPYRFDKIKYVNYGNFYEDGLKI